MDKKYSFKIVENLDEIKMYVGYNSKFLLNKIENCAADSCILIRKYLTHSDLLTRGKYTDKDFKNYRLYYQNSEELAELAKKQKVATAKQSNIRVPSIFYDVLKLKRYKENGNRQYDILKDSERSVFIPKDSLEHFNLLEFNKLCKINDKCEYDKKINLELTDFGNKCNEEKEDCIKLDSLHIAAHGIGTKNDKLFHGIRSFVFKGDVLNILLLNDSNEIYLFFERNEMYFKLLSKKVPIWSDYSEDDKKSIVFSLALNELDICRKIDEDQHGEINKIIEEYEKNYNKTIVSCLQEERAPKKRWYQKKWKEVLLKLDEVRYSSTGKAVCAITNISGEYDKLGKLFIASHIKPYYQCISEQKYDEAFDPHNGLILCANMDALFDRHLISIDQQGRILKSVAVKKIDWKIAQRSFKKINSYYLTKERLSYLGVHEQEFNNKNK